MEKKTIGGLIAALRRANGMTQKDLARRLNVSDKTVSRWERDDGAPDLAAIPVIAEIFGVTCDELLRGERTAPEDRAAPAESAAAARGEKQRRRLLKSALSQYRSRSYIAMGVMAAGVLAALICDLAFLEGILGALIGATLVTAGVVCQAVFANRAFLSVEDAPLTPEEESAYRRRVIRLAQRAGGLAAGCVGFALPMLLVKGTHMGLDAPSLLVLGAVGAAALLLLYAAVLYFLNAALLNRGVYTLPEREAAAYRRNHKRKRTCALVLAALLAVTFLGHQAATMIWGPWTIMDGTTFEDYESFTAYMEQDLPDESGLAAETARPPEAQSGPPVYYDESGNEISEEEALTRRLEDANGNVVCRYVERNRQVISVQYTPRDGTVLPITVYTEADYQAARQTAAARHVLFAAAYCAEVLAVVLVYFRKRAK